MTWKDDGPIAYGLVSVLKGCGNNANCDGEGLPVRPDKSRCSFIEAAKKKKKRGSASGEVIVFM